MDGANDATAGARDGRRGVTMLARRAALVGAGAVLFATWRRPCAQSRDAQARVGWLSSYPAQAGGTRHRSFTIFFERLQQLGWKQGDNFVFDFRGRAVGESLEHGASSLVASKCDVLIAQGTEAVKLLRDSSGDVPVVMAGVSDPVGAGLIDTLARPGGKVTGVSMIGQELFAKIVSFLGELAPRTKRIALLTVASNPANAFFARTLADAAASRGLTSKELSVASPDELERAIASVQVDALVVNFDPTFFGHLKRMADAARARKLPMGSNDFGDLTRAGGLFSYSPDVDEITVRVAEYVDRLLRCARAADIPVAQPTRYRFVVNLATASAIGVKVPASHLVRADEVIR